MKKFLFGLTLLFLFLLPIIGIAATGDILAVRIVYNTPTAGSICNGWVAEIDIENLNTGGNYSMGLGTNNDPSAAKIVFSVRSDGYDNTGSVVHITRTVYGTHSLRKPYPNHAVADESKVSTTLTVRVALSDFIYSSDDNITVNILSGFYTGSNATTGMSVTNNSTLTHPKVVGRWAWPPRERITTADFLVEMMGFHRSAINGKPLACVKITAIGETSAASVTKTVTAMTVSTRTGDANKVLVYAATFTSSDWTAFTQGEVIRFRFQCYPWVGDSNSVLDSTTAGDGIAQPSARMGPLYAVLDKTGGYGLAFAVVDPVNGRESSLKTWVYATQSAVESAYAGDNTLSYKYIGRAAEGIKAYNNDNYSRNEPGGGVILLVSATHSIGAYSPGSLGASKIWTIVQPLTGVARTNANVNGGPGTANSGSLLLKLSGISITQSGTGYIWGDASSGELWIDDCLLNITNSSEFASWAAMYFTRNAVTALTGGFTSSFGPRSGNYAPAPIIRGNNKTGSAISGDCYTQIGNKQILPIWVDEAIYGTVSDDNILAFNSVYNYNGPFLSALWVGNTSIGHAFVQNIYESVTGTQPVLSIATGLASANTVYNVLIWHNSISGNRNNLGYDEIVSGGALRSKWSEIGNVLYEWNNKGDIWATNANCVGNWPVAYNVGSYGNVIGRYTAQGDFDGIWTAANGTVGWVNDASAQGTNLGNGDYRLTSSSNGINLIPSAHSILPFDLAGNSRRNDGTGSAGAYECGISPSSVQGLTITGGVLK